MPADLIYMSVTVYNSFLNAHVVEIEQLSIVLFVCLFVCLWCIVPLENFSLTWRRHHYQILIFARHSWSLSSEGSLASHTSYDTGHPFIMFISEDPWYSHQLPSVWQWSCHFLVLRLNSKKGIAKKYQINCDLMIQLRKSRTLCLATAENGWHGTKGISAVRRGRGYHYMYLRNGGKHGMGMQSSLA